jgi:carbonic anhydrase/acetyltransferase-like protein (isoleucine patch superfamily)
MSRFILPFADRGPTIDPRAFVAETAAVIGDVTIGAGSSVWYGCTLRGDLNRITIGAGTNIQDGSVVHVNHDPAGDYRETGGGMPTRIGDRVTIAHMALIHACTLEDDAFVGMGAIVMDEAVVESGAMVAAGALVTPGKRVKTGQLWAGRPARFLRDITDEERARFAYIATHYSELAAAYLAQRAGR